MRIYIEYFSVQKDDIINRLNKVMSSVTFKTIINVNRISFGILESSDSEELFKVKKTLIDIIHNELSEEQFIKIIRNNNVKNNELYDPIFQENIDIFKPKSTEQLLKDIDLNK